MNAKQIAEISPHAKKFNLANKVIKTELAFEGGNAGKPCNKLTLKTGECIEQNMLVKDT